MSWVPEIYRKVKESTLPPSTRHQQQPCFLQIYVHTETYDPLVLEKQQPLTRQHPGARNGGHFDTTITTTRFLRRPQRGGCRSLHHPAYCYCSSSCSSRSWLLLVLITSTSTSTNYYYSYYYNCCYCYYYCCCYLGFPTSVASAAGTGVAAFKACRS